MNFSTRAVRFDQCPGDPYRPAATPIYQTATFEQESAEEFGRFDYSRSGNPTREVLETHLANLEHGRRAFAFASGLAAISAITRFLKPGDEVLAGDDLYGGTYRLFSRILEPRGITVRYEDLTDLRDAPAHFSERTRLVHVESLTNPLLRACDIRALAELAHSRGARLSVDASAVSPYLQRPLDLGADYVVHSATKYLCGHADVTAGVVAVRDAALAEELYLIQNGEGAVLGPFDTFLLLRGVKTLALRLDRQQQSAQRIAEWLSRTPGVTRVHFPGLADHPTGSVHKRQATGPGAVVSFETGDPELSRRIVESLSLFAIAVSFGSIASTASLPCRMSHASIPASVRARRGFPEDLVRLSIGIEDVGDLIADLDRVIAEAAAVVPGSVVAVK
jgi:cystathionine beta-lyase